MEIAMTHQPHSFPVDPARLQSMGKTAARLSETSGLSLTEAVVRTIGHEKLNSEQVRRIVETANVAAFNQKYSSMAGDHRFVNLDHGPADPAQVLQSLDQGPADSYASDYDLPPTKTASRTPVYAVIPRTVSGAVGEIVALQSKLAAMHETAVQDVLASEFDLQEAAEELRDQAKTAALGGAESGEILAAWAEIHPTYAKAAARAIWGEVPAMQKVAGRRVSSDARVVQTFHRFTKAASAWTKRSQARREIEAEISRVGSWLADRKVS